MDVHLHILNVPSLANNLPLLTNNSLSIHSLAWSDKEKVASAAGKNNYIMKVSKENNWIADISTSAWFSFNVSLLMLKDRVNIYAG